MFLTPDGCIVAVVDRRCRARYRTPSVHESTGEANGEHDDDGHLATSDSELTGSMTAILNGRPQASTTQLLDVCVCLVTHCMHLFRSLSLNTPPSTQVPPPDVFIHELRRP